MLIKANSYIDGKSYAYSIEEGRFTSIQQIPYDSELPILSSGFQDIQINGYNGLDFNNEFDFQYADQVAQQLIQKGIFSIYPTIITNSEERIIQLGKQILQWMRESRIASEIIKGIHLEGPYISPKDGARGAHNLAYVRPPNVEEFNRIQAHLNHFIKVLTLSPEWENTDTFIKQVSQSVVIAIGHTVANPEQIHRVSVAGARLSTHLGNGAEGLLARHPNYIWAQMADDQLYASVIADGFHLDTDVLKVISKVKQNKLILISDAVNLAGQAPGQYEQVVGGDVVLSDEGRLCLADAPQYLAGCAMDLLQCANHYYKQVGKDAIDVIRCMTLNVENLFREESTVKVGQTANFVLTDRNSFTIKKSFMDGKDWLL